MLCSGGLDSVVLLAHEAGRAPALPIYVSVGLAWEPDEERRLTRILSGSPFAGGVQPLVRLEVSMRDIYPESHWARRGTPPAYDTPDEDVYLVGRNVVLLSKAAVLCAQRGVSRLALGPLDANPFPDATPEFFRAMGQAMSLGLDHPIEIAAPFASFRKADVIRRGTTLGVDLAATLSCMSPRAGQHCGLCSKCRERRDAFEEAGITDPTTYDAQSPRA